jgi:hypothetical protein
MSDTLAGKVICGPVLRRADGLYSYDIWDGVNGLVPGYRYAEIGAAIYARKRALRGGVIGCETVDEFREKVGQ